MYFKENHEMKKIPKSSFFVKCNLKILLIFLFTINTILKRFKRSVLNAIYILAYFTDL
ncbi:hypothetical protein B4113_0206 [Geobacillus sp. B4113_201601]|nr:hypothetical protein B4113_0206 [Geobacillus sp. B4113_201601]